MNEDYDEVEGVAQRIAETLLARGFDTTDVMENALQEGQFFFDVEVDGIEVTVTVGPYSGGTNGAWP